MGARPQAATRARCGASRAHLAARSGAYAAVAEWSYGWWARMCCSSCASCVRHRAQSSRGDGWTTEVGLAVSTQGQAVPAHVSACSLSPPPSPHVCALTPPGPRSRPTLRAHATSPCYEQVLIEEARANLLEIAHCIRRDHRALPLQQ